MMKFVCLNCGSTEWSRRTKGTGGKFVKCAKCGEISTVTSSDISLIPPSASFMSWPGKEEWESSEFYPKENQ